MDRTALIQSSAFLQFFALPNDVKSRLALEAKTSGAEIFPDWKAKEMTIDELAVGGTALLAGDVMIATTTNAAPAGGGVGIVQKIYFLRHV